MKNYFGESLLVMKKALFSDKLNLTFLLSTIIVAFVDFIIWRARLEIPDLFVYTGFNIYPVQYLAIVLIINTLMAIFSYSKEKEISYLLLCTNIFLVLLVLVLEIFYLKNIQPIPNI